MNKKTTKDIVILSAIFFFSCLLFRRAFYGFDWSDDSYYSAIVYRFLRGDSLFSDSWDIHQIYAVILVPLYWIYTKILGTTGIILFSRLIRALIISGESAGLYWKFRNKSGRIMSFLTSIMVLSFESSFGLSYNTMMIEASIMAVLLLPIGEKHKGFLYFFASGFFSGIAVQAYPSIALVVPCFVVYIILNEGTNKWKNLTWYISGGIAVFLFFVFFLCYNSSLEALQKNIHYLFVDSEHNEGHFSLHTHYSGLQELIDKRVIVLLIISNLLAATSWIIKGISKKAVQSIVIAILFVVVFMQWINIQAEYSKGAIHYRLFFSISLVFPTLLLLNKCKWNNVILLYLGGMLGSIGVNIATNNGPTFYVYPYMFSAVATLLYAGGMIASVLKTQKDIKKRVAIWVPAVCLIVYMFGASLNYVYRDGLLDTLKVKMEIGPAAGIYTTELKAQQYEETVEAIDNYMPKEGNVLYTKLLPFGYLCSSAKPATPRLWRTNLDYSMYEEYYDNNPEKKPDAIYIANEQYGITNSGIVIGEYMKKYMDSTPHDTIELNCGTIIRFY